MAAKTWATSDQRAKHARAQQRRLGMLAEAEPDMRLRLQLLDLAEEYRKLAESIERGGNDPILQAIVTSGGTVSGTQGRLN